MNKEITTPVLFLIFNQPQITKITFDEIRKAKPKRLFVSADGPRENKPKEMFECQLTRDMVSQNIDWDCEVNFRFLDKNMGVKQAVSSAITWFLDEVEAGIIIEYDCVPSQSFFWFCQELLEKYRDDERIMAINGSNFMFDEKVGDATYYFSKIPLVWGWATWKRAWKHWDGELLSYEEFKQNNSLQNIFKSKKTISYWKDKFDQIVNHVDTTWGHPWDYAVMSQNGLCITCNCNLISNIGFTANGTHANEEDHVLSNLMRYELEIIKHPNTMVPSIDADEKVMLRVPRLSRFRTFVVSLKPYVPNKMYTVAKKAYYFFVNVYHSKSK